MLSAQSLRLIDRMEYYNMKYLPLIITLVLILVIIGIIYAVYIRIKRKLQNISQLAFGTSDIRQGVTKMQQEYASTPKSVSAMTSLCLPKIVKDFPDFQFNEIGRASCRERV